MIAHQPWPTFDEAKTVDQKIEIAVQVSGKLRGTIKIALDATQEEALKLAYENEAVKAAVEGKNIIKEIYVKNKIVNIVAK